MAVEFKDYYRILDLAEDATDAELKDIFQAARDEHNTMHEEARLFNSPHERVRVFLQPYLSDKGRRWAVPHTSLNSPDDVSLPGSKRPWWKIWD